MKVICGLGNPGKNYAPHRHNIGFQVVELFASAAGFSWVGPKFEAMYCMGAFQKERLFLLKPLTYMNLSGHSLRQALHFYKVELSDVLVVHDELDLPLGKLQFKQGGGHGGHNGLRSISEQLGNNHYARLRFGIGKPQGENAQERVISHVLSAFSAEEKPVQEAAAQQAVKALGCWLENGLASAMNVYNQRKAATKPPG